MDGEEAQPGVTLNPETNEDIEEDLDFEDYSEETNELFNRIKWKMETTELNGVMNEIERGWVTNIKSDLNIVKALVVGFCNQKYMKAHVKHKLMCINKEVENVMINHLIIEREKNKEEEERKVTAKTSEWLYSISKKTEKIKNLVSQFGSLPEEERSKTGSKREKQKTVSNSTECYKMCIEESLLISPIITGSLKKSYDHLPSNELKLCLLSLAAFPEDFIIKKRPLIYWWMSEGFVVENGNSKSSAEEVGEQNFTQLIQLGLIQPWYESGNTTDQPHNNVHVQGCSVHPWIRRMLVPIAMEARLFEFFGVPKKEEHPPMTMTGNPRSRRVCLYDDGEGVDHISTWKTRTRKYCNKFRERFKWMKANAALLENIKNDARWENIKKVQHDVKEVSDRQKKLLHIYTKFLAPLNTLVAWSDHHNALLNALNHSLSDVKAQIADAIKNINDDEHQNIFKKLQDEQMKLLKDIEGLEKVAKDQLNYLDIMLEPKWMNDPVVYNRNKHCEILQEKEESLFGHNDLNNPFPFPFPMKKNNNNKRTTTSTSNRRSNAKKSDAVSNDEAAAERLLAIINVTQKYLDMDHEPLGKMKYLRTLHLGRWRDSLPVPHIEVENGRIFEALFHVAKHLKYLSLRGISRITTLPSTISKCCNLQILDLKACYNLETLPTEINKLYKLTHFDVSECYLLQNTNLWSLVQHLHFLQTLKGLKLDQSNLNSLQALAAAGTLRKLSIILTTPIFNIHLLTTLSKLCILTITWRVVMPQQQPAPEKISDANTETTPHPKPEISDEEGVKGSIEKALPNLKKLDLRCYPNKTWPNWVKKHSSLETLYITGGDLEEFPMLDLDLQNLQLLRFKYLTKLKLGPDNTPQPKSTKFPSLITFLNHDSKPKK
ncbi:uncharacterized protein LOC115997289 [Ipomoea triloba]|uniref:uncharacterized protein LOC115997289 n=1 Tax=Ipomoea triloba TaxID=35885 RepID=UPI00125D458E|nr:uncharacterized protein LOC115997289 [Ipomoea triloba]